MLTEIQNGTLATNLIQGMNAGGRAQCLATRRMEADQPREKVGKDLRGMMSWLKDK